MAIPKELLQPLLKDSTSPEDLLGENGILKELTKGLVEAALGAELTEHLGYEKHDTREKPTGNRRNGSSKKTIRTDQGEVDIAVPRDRASSFEPKRVAKHQKEIPGFSDKVLSMYARGMSTREMAEHLKEIYGTEVSPQFIRSVTNGVAESLEQWRNRDLEPVYPVVFLDAVFVESTGRPAMWSNARCTWPSPLPLRARRNYSGCGWQKRKDRNSGCRC